MPPKTDWDSTRYRRAYTDKDRIIDNIQKTRASVDSNKFVQKAQKNFFRGK